jgi:hypothetical protein
VMRHTQTKRGLSFFTLFLSHQFLDAGMEHKMLVKNNAQFSSKLRDESFDPN